MSWLKYTSNEMFSSTELVRQNKKIFDKLNKKEIEKAIILRDGKPGIILLDFNEYEKIMTEYMNLKDKKTVPQETKKEVQNNTIEKISDIELKSEQSKTKEKDDALKDFWE